MPPPVARKRSSTGGILPGQRTRSGQMILTEEDWAVTLEHIIERDYFPELPRLQNKADWLEAVRTGDPRTLAQAQENIMRRRAGLRTPLLDRDQASGKTSTRPDPTPGRWSGAHNNNHQGWRTDSTPDRRTMAVDEEPLGPALQVPALSLDEFCAQYTSEDNASFEDILARYNERQRQRKAWAYKQGNHKLLMPVPQHHQHHHHHHPSGEPKTERIDDGYGSGGQPLWQVTTLARVEPPKSRLYYDNSQQAELALTDAELQHQVGHLGAPRQVVIKNTRFTSGTDFHSRGSSSGATSQSTSGRTSLASTPRHGHSRGRDSPYDLLGRNQPPSINRRRGDYSLLSTPLVKPGVHDQGPLMTWGTLGSTPLRLDSEGRPEGGGEADDLDLTMEDGGAGGGGEYGFTMKDLSVREELAERLTHKARAKREQREQRERVNGRRGGKAGAAQTPRREGGEGGGGQLSAAGRQLLRRLSTPLRKK